MMRNYYTKEEGSVARNTSMIEVVSALGIQVRDAGKIHGYDAYRLAEHDSLIFHKNIWYWNSRDDKGNTVDFLVKYFGLTVKESILKILELTSQGKDYKVSRVNNVEFHNIDKQSLILPRTNIDNNRVIAYLNQTRGIDYSIIKNLIKKRLLFEEYKTHNALFFGYDQEQKSRYIFKRGTIPGKRFAGEASGSDKKYAFSIPGITNTICVFESAIDALSYLSLHKDCKDTLQSLGGTGLEALDTRLKMNPAIRTIKVCTDNDDAGRACFKRIQQKYIDYEIKEELPSKKDYNEDLLFLLQTRDKELTL